jgi:hypothetical protein
VNFVQALQEFKASITRKGNNSQRNGIKPA